jgi:hypothetical protein
MRFIGFDFSIKNNYTKKTKGISFILALNIEIRIFGENN